MKLRLLLILILAPALLLVCAYTCRADLQADKIAQDKTPWFNVQDPLGVISTHGCWFRAVTSYGDRLTLVTYEVKYGNGWGWTWTTPDGRGGSFL